VDQGLGAVRIDQPQRDQRVVGRPREAAQHRSRLRPSGLVVLDLDTPGPAHPDLAISGADVLAQIVADHGQPWPATCTVGTPGGGWQLYYLMPAGRQIRNSAAKVGPGIDHRGGGYVVAPPSIRDDCGGRRYERVDVAPFPVTRTVEQPPAWLADLMDPPQAPAPAGRPVRIPGALPVAAGRPVRLADAAPDGVSRYAWKALLGELDRVLAAGEGCRNATLNRAAFALGQLAGAGLLDPATVEAALLDAAVEVGLGQLEAARTIASGLRSGSAQPRAVAR